jgi:hypothetical protein
MNDLTMAESAVAQHEILTSYIKAGFTRAEALELLKVLIAVNKS